MICHANYNYYLKCKNWYWGLKNISYQQKNIKVVGMSGWNRAPASFGGGSYALKQYSSMQETLLFCNRTLKLVFHNSVRNEGIEWNCQFNKKENQHYFLMLSEYLKLACRQKCVFISFRLLNSNILFQNLNILKYKWGFRKLIDALLRYWFELNYFYFQ